MSLTSRHRDNKPRASTLRPSTLLMSLLVLVGVASTGFAAFTGTDQFVPVVGRIQGVGDPRPEYYSTLWLTNQSDRSTAAVLLEFYKRLTSRQILPDYPLPKT